MSGSGWYYVENDARIGPVERSELERLISQGSITAQTMVWREGMSGWEEAARLPKFQNRIHRQPGPGSRCLIFDCLCPQAHLRAPAASFLLGEHVGNW